jgi:hypothetical protein
MTTDVDSFNALFPFMEEIVKLDSRFSNSDSSQRIIVLADNSAESKERSISRQEGEEYAGKLGAQYIEIDAWDEASFDQLRRALSDCAAFLIHREVESE